MSFRAIISGAKLAAVEAAAGRSLKAEAERELARATEDLTSYQEAIDTHRSKGQLTEASNLTKRCEFLREHIATLTQRVDRPFTIPRSILTQQPLGDRIFVLRDREDALSEGKFGSKIIKPDTGNSLMQTGWLLAIGPLVGCLDNSTLHLAIGGSPEEWLGARAVWGRYVGGVLMSEDLDSEYSSRYLCLRESDLWSIDVE